MIPLILNLSTKPRCVTALSTGCLMTYDINCTKIATCQNQNTLQWDTECKYCRNSASSCNIHAVQQDTQSFLIIEFIHHVLARHVSDLTGPSSGALYKLHLQIWYAVIRILLDMSGRYFIRNSQTCRVVCVLPHTKSANTACKMLLKMGRWGLKHVELTRDE